jgi:hypothetical protein
MDIRTGVRVYSDTHIRRWWWPIPETAWWIEINVHLPYAATITGTCGPFDSWVAAESSAQELTGIFETAHQVMR